MKVGEIEAACTLEDPQSFFSDIFGIFFNLITYIFDCLIMYMMVSVCIEKKLNSLIMYCSFV